jgi:hypothetical protein
MSDQPRPATTIPARYIRWAIWFVAGKVVLLAVVFGLLFAIGPNLD